jgi:trimethylamine--corrinoid protein Co-methyltransferase
VDQASSLEMLVFQHEVIGYVERVMRGVTVDAEHLALEVIDEVGPGGIFIDQEHTVRHFRQEVWMPTLLDREYWPTWEKAGRPATADRVKTRLRDLLAAYQPTPMDDRAERDLAKVLHAARKTLH